MKPSQTCAASTMSMNLVLAHAGAAAATWQPAWAWAGRASASVGGQQPGAARTVAAGAAVVQRGAGPAHQQPAVGVAVGGKRAGDGATDPKPKRSRGRQHGFRPGMQWRTTATL